MRRGAFAELLFRLLATLAALGVMQALGTMMEAIGGEGALGHAASAPGTPAYPVAREPSASTHASYGSSRSPESDSTVTSPAASSSPVVR